MMSSMLERYPLMSPVLSALIKPLYRLSQPFTVRPQSSRCSSFLKKASLTTSSAPLMALKPTSNSFMASTLMVKRSASCFMIPPVSWPSLLVALSSRLMSSSSFLPSWTRCLSCSMLLERASPKGEFFSSSVRWRYCDESSTKAFDSSLILPRAERLTVSI